MDARETKRCTKCGEEKALEEFYADKHHRDGRTSACRECERHREAAARRARGQAEKIGLARNATHKRCSRCKETKRVADFHPVSRSDGWAGFSSMCRVCLAEHQRERARAGLRRRHGLTALERAALVERVGGVCEACGVTLADKRPEIDHDHRCCPGEQGCPSCIRGVLCHGCNVAIGMVADSPARLRALADYLERPRPASPRGQA